MQHVTLNNGRQMPIVGFGVFQIADPKECERSVVDAIESRLPADRHGGVVHERRGRRPRSAASGVAREQLFVTTKLWVQDTGYERTRHAIDKSLKSAATRLSGPVPDPPAVR